MMRSAIWFVGALALVACGDDDDGPTDPNLDGGRPDGSVDAGPDASKSDGGLDGSTPSCESLDQTYKLSLEGGNAPVRYRYTLSSTGAVTVDVEPNRFEDAGTLACSGQLGTCQRGGLDVSDVVAALRNASSFWGDGETVLGVDSRPVDGSVLVVERTSDGKKIVVGDPCDRGQGAPACTDAPASAQALRTVFDRLRTEVTLGDKSDGGMSSRCKP